MIRFLFNRVSDVVAATILAALTAVVLLERRGVADTVVALCLAGVGLSVVAGHLGALTMLRRHQGSAAMVALCAQLETVLRDHPGDLLESLDGRLRFVVARRRGVGVHSVDNDVETPQPGQTVAVTAVGFTLAPSPPLPAGIVLRQVNALLLRQSPDGQLTVSDAPRGPRRRRVLQALDPMGPLRRSLRSGWGVASEDEVRELVEQIGAATVVDLPDE